MIGSTPPRPFSVPRSCLWAIAVAGAVAAAGAAARVAGDGWSFRTDPHDPSGSSVILTVNTPGDPFKDLFFYPPPNTLTSQSGNYTISNVGVPAGGKPATCQVIAGFQGHQGIGCTGYGSTEVAELQFVTSPPMPPDSQSKLVLDNANGAGARAYVVVGPTIISCEDEQEQLKDARALLDDLDAAASDEEAIGRALRDALFAQQYLYNLQHPAHGGSGPGGGPHVYLGSHGPDFTRAVAEAQAAERALRQQEKEDNALLQRRDAVKRWVASLQAQLDDCLNGKAQSFRAPASSNPLGGSSAATDCSKQQAAVANAQTEVAAVQSALARLVALHLDRAQAKALDAARLFQKLASSARPPSAAHTLKQLAAAEKKVAAGLGHGVPALSHLHAATADVQKAAAAAQKALDHCKTN